MAQVKPGIETAFVAIFLVLFGALEGSAVFDGDAIAMALSGLGVVGTIILMWLKRSGA